MIVFQVWLNWSNERNTKNTMSHLYFNANVPMPDIGWIYEEESDYSEENMCGNVFSIISFWAWTKNTCGNMSHEKATKHIQASAANLLHIRIGNLDWCKCNHFKNKAGEIDCLCCRGEDATLIALAKFPGHGGNISPSISYGHLLNYSHTC